MRRLIFGLLIFGAVVGVAELAARRLVSKPLDCLAGSDDPELLYGLRPGSYQSDGWFLRGPDFEIRIDANRCRHTWDNPDPASETVLFMGDSMTFGLGVGDRETVPALVGESLRASGRPGLAIRNCAVPGYNLGQAVRRIEELVQTLSPQVIALVVHPADLERPFDFSSLAPEGGIARTLLAQSRLARLVYLLGRVLVVRADRQGGEPVGLDRSVIRGYLERLQAAAEKARSRVIVFRLGEISHSDVSFEKMLSSFPFLSREIRSPPEGDEYFLPDNEHWTAKGSQLVAAQVAGLLEADLSVPRLCGPSR